MQCMNVPGAFLSLAYFFWHRVYNLQILITFYLLISDTCFFVSNCRQFTNKSSKHHCKNCKVSLCGAIFLVKKLTFLCDSKITGE